MDYYNDDIKRDWLANFNGKQEKTLTNFGPWQDSPKKKPQSVNLPSLRTKQKKHYNIENTTQRTPSSQLTVAYHFDTKRANRNENPQEIIYRELIRIQNNLLNQPNVKQHKIREFTLENESFSQQRQNTQKLGQKQCLNGFKPLLPKSQLHSRRKQYNDINQRQKCYTSQPEDHIQQIQQIIRRNHVFMYKNELQAKFKIKEIAKKGFTKIDLSLDL